MTKQEFKKEVVIYKSHRLANKLISVTYAMVLAKNDCGNPTTIGGERTEVLKDFGGALTSLYYHYA